jgi:hypothetical protein
MDNEQISKKDLLEEMGISYGQLYRWKRKQLIPEEWFIRKSTFTGQETFFPRSLILARINKILNMKEDLSLDELADKFSPTLMEFELRKSELAQRNIVSRNSMDCYVGNDPEDTIYAYEVILALYVTDKLLQSGDMGLEEGKNLYLTISENLLKFEGKPCEVIFARKMGVSLFALVSAGSELYWENGVRVVARLSMSECSEQLKGALDGGGEKDE